MVRSRVIEFIRQRVTPRRHWPVEADRPIFDSRLRIRFVKRTVKPQLSARLVKLLCGKLILIPLVPVGGKVDDTTPLARGDFENTSAEAFRFFGGFRFPCQPSLLTRHIERLNSTALGR